MKNSMKKAIALLTASLLLGAAGLTGAGAASVRADEKAAALAKKAFKCGKTIRQLCEEEQVLPKDQLDEGLDVVRMTKPLSK